MARQSFISHAVNGYSRYDLPESKAFSCTPGVLYPVRIDYVNPRDRITIDQGIDVRSNPLQVPSFNPYVIRLHRFFVPLQLYHPEMRTNSSEFDMNSLSFNFIPYGTYSNSEATAEGIFTSGGRASVGSLFHWLRVGHRPTLSYGNLETWTPDQKKEFDAKDWNDCKYCRLILQQKDKTEIHRKRPNIANYRNAVQKKQLNSNILK